MSDAELSANLTRAKALCKRIANRIMADTHDLSVIEESRDRLQEEVNRRVQANRHQEAAVTSEAPAD